MLSCRLHFTVRKFEGNFLGNFKVKSHAEMQAFQRRSNLPRLLWMRQANRRCITILWDAPGAECNA